MTFISINVKFVQALARRKSSPAPAASPGASISSAAVSSRSMPSNYNAPSMKLPVGRCGWFLSLSPFMMTTSRGKKIQSSCDCKWCVNFTLMLNYYTPVFIYRIQNRKILTFIACLVFLVVGMVLV